MQTQQSHDRWYLDPRLWVELFVVVNLAFLALDIYIAHSVNQFRRAAEYIPFYFSLLAPVVLAVGLIANYKLRSAAVGRDLGYFVGSIAVVIGIAGVVLHLDSRFFYERTLKSLTYAAPFAAPLAYTGLGLLLIMNRMVDSRKIEWGQWVLLLALAGFFGNFVLSLTDHAANGFFRLAEWVPVISSALAVAFLIVPLLMPVTSKFLLVCGAVLVLQVVVGLMGFVFHAQANLRGPSVRFWDNLINGAPPMAPLLFVNLVLLAAIGLWEIHKHRTLSDLGKTQSQV